MLRFQTIRRKEFEIFIEITKSQVAATDEDQTLNKGGLFCLFIFIVISALAHHKSKFPFSFISNTSIQSHNQGHRTVNFLHRFCLVWFNVPGRVGLHVDVVYHPRKHRMTTMGNFPSKVNFISSLVGGLISLNPDQRHYGKTSTF